MCNDRQKKPSVISNSKFKFGIDLSDNGISWSGPIDQIRGGGEDGCGGRNTILYKYNMTMLEKILKSKIGILKRVFKITENRANRYITGVGAGNGEDKHIY